MNPAELADALRKTLEDYRVSRSERKALKQLFSETLDSSNDFALIRSKAFEIARTELEHRSGSPGHSREISLWLEDVVKLLIQRPQKASTNSQAIFSSQEDCARYIQGLISTTRKSLDICVFTITDDRITNSIMEAFKRKILVRIISDDEKASDKGSDVFRLKQLGIEVRTDRNENHMHHKFAIFDGNRLLNGSYNWTRSAALRNEENFVVTDDSGLVREFNSHFERLWHLFG